jgi:8-oxo-dGTP diphosphatase
VTEALARLWWALRGRWQWYVLWLVHHKFVVGVTGVLVDGEGRVLLQRHRFWRPGSWGLPGGYAEHGETLEQALQREVREESGYEIEVDRLIHVVSGYRLRLEAAFQGRIVGGTLRVDPKEVLEARFFAPAELPPGLLATHRELIATALGPGEPG